MDDALNYVVRVAGAGISIIPLFATIFIINGAMQGLGKFGGFITGIKSEGLKQKARDYAGYNENRRSANAHAGQPTVGGGKFRRRTRRELRNQAAETAAKSGQAQFGVADDKAKAYTQSISQGNAQISAINAANNTRFATGVATGDIDVRQGMNAKAADDAEVKKAIAAQQERAVAEAIKDVELSAKFEPGAVASIAAAMEDAIKSGDGIGARAYQNMLMRAGGAGTEAYRGALSRLSPEENNSGAMRDVKRNLLMNHGGVKETAADLIKHAADPGKKDAAGNVVGPPRTMSEVSGDAKTWDLSPEDLVKQKSHSLKEAVAAGGVSVEKAREIQKDDQLYRRLDKEGRAQIDKAAGGSRDELSIPHDSPSGDTTGYL